MLHRFAVFDVDGTVRRPSGAHHPKAPPRPLGRTLHALQRDGVGVLAATGASIDSLKITEGQLAFRFPIAAVSYGVRVIRRGGHVPSEVLLTPRGEQLAFGEVIPDLDRIASRHSAVLDDRRAAFTMFFTSPEAFEAARHEVEVLVAPVPELRFTANRCDFGITVLPVSASKALLVQYVREVLGGNIVLAAGDTASDLPLLEAAEFPIATRTLEGSALHPELVELIERRGVGYMAREDEPHGLGLLAGIKAAREQGFVA